MRRLLLFALLLTACAAAPLTGDVNPITAQRVLDEQRYALTQDAQRAAVATVERVGTLQALDAQSTQAANVALMATVAADTERRHAAETAVAPATQIAVARLSAEATQAAVDDIARNTSARRWDAVWFGAVALAFILAAVAVYYLHQLGRVHIASLRFRDLGNGVVAELDDAHGWQTWPTREIAAAERKPAALPQAVSAFDRARAQYEHEWETAIRRFVMLGEQVGYSIRDLTPAYMSDPAWRDITTRLYLAGVFRLKPSAGWADGWDARRFGERWRNGLTVPLPPYQAGFAAPVVTLPAHTTHTTTVNTGPTEGVEGVLAGDGRTVYALVEQE